MLTVNTDENKSTCFKFIGMDSTKSVTRLITDDVNLISSTTLEDCSDTCSFYNGPSDATIMAFGESSESCGSIAYASGGESCGSIAYSSGGESCGSIATSSVGGGFSGGGGSFGGGCSYSC